jgi:hypothetical protein
MVKTGMPRCILTGLLARGALSRAIVNSKHILNNAAGALVFFNTMTVLDGVFFVWHRIASLQSATSLLFFTRVSVSKSGKRGWKSSKKNMTHHLIWHPGYSRRPSLPVLMDDEHMEGAVNEAAQDGQQDDQSGDGLAGVARASLSSKEILVSVV